MGWYVCFKALLEHDGDSSKITSDRKAEIDKTNPNSPAEAWNLAERKYKEAWSNFCHDFATGKYGHYLDTDRGKFFELRNASWILHKEEL